MSKVLLFLCGCLWASLANAAPRPEEPSNVVQAIVPARNGPVVLLEDAGASDDSDLEGAEAAHYGYGGGFGHGGYGGGFGHGGGFGGGFGFRKFGGFGGGGFGHPGFGGFGGHGLGGGFGGGGGFVVGGGFIKGGGFYGKK